MDLSAELTPAETERAHELMHNGRTWLLVEYRKRCRELGKSSLGRRFAEWLPIELAKAIVLLERPDKPDRPEKGGRVRFT